MDSKYVENIFEKLMQIPENRSCFECGLPHVSWTSVTNGIFVCLNCSGLHRGFGVSVSFVRSTKMDSWTQKQLSFIINGGNKNLKDFFENYNLLNSTPIDFKYKTKAGQYYRDRLRAIVENGQIPEAPSLEEGMQIINFNNPEFEAMPQKGIGNSVNNEKEKKDFMKEFKDLVESSYEKTKNSVENIKNKLNDPVVKNDVKKFGDNMIHKSKEFGEKSVKVAKEGFQNMKKGMFSVINYVKDKTKSKEGKEKHEKQEKQEKQEKNETKNHEKNNFEMNKNNKKKDEMEISEQKPIQTIDYQDYFQSIEDYNPNRNYQESPKKLEESKENNVVIIEKKVEIKTNADIINNAIQKDEDLLNIHEDSWNH